MRSQGSTTLVEFRVPLTRQQAEAIYAQGREAVIFVLMQLAARLGDTPQPSTNASTPSGMVPPYEKPTVRGRLRDARGRGLRRAGRLRQGQREERQDNQRAKSRPMVHGLATREQRSSPPSIAHRRACVKAQGRLGVPSSV